MKVSPDSFEEVGCNLCGSDQNKTLTAISIDGRQVARMVRCEDCGLEYTNPRPTVSFVSELYQSAYRERVASQSEERELTAGSSGSRVGRDRYADYVSTISRLTPPGSGGRLLDVGTGFGHLLDLAKARGWEIWGTEISREAAEVAKRSTGAEIVVAENLEDADFPDEFFGAITMSAVIEHLRDPFGALREIHRILKTGGTLGISTDNNDSLFLGLGQLRDKVEVRYEGMTGRRFPLRGRNKARYDVIATSYDKGVYTLMPARDDAKTVTNFCIWVFQHLFFFTPASLRRMLERARFSVAYYPAGSILGPPATGKRRILQNELVNRVGRLVGRQSEIVYYAAKV